MGNYLNTTEAFTMYREVFNSPYFVDKTAILEEIIPRMETTEKYICITRPRRFGKTVMANLISSFCSKGCDAETLFQTLDIGKSQYYKEHLNKHNVVHISFNEIPKNCQSYGSYMERIERNLIEDLKSAYPEVAADIQKDAVWDVFKRVYDARPETRFVFILDEWDYIFHRDFVTNEDKGAYIDFLSNLLKGKPYVSLAYMTGILPITKYASGSELNMFLEYTMVSEELFSEYFGFTEPQVDRIFKEYLARQKRPKVTREGLRMWYDGYHTRSGERVYNPRSVIAALTNNNLGNYWTSSGPYDEIFYYIQYNTDDVRDALAKMVSGMGVPCKVREYAATSMNLKTKDEIFSAMVVYGFLSFENGCVRIPNKELMDKFQDVLQKEPSLGYVFQLAKESEHMLEATLSGDTETVCRILEYTHNTEIPLLSYNNESDLTVVVTLAYLSARDNYIVTREDKGGIGYVDFSFTPVNPDDDCIILELKVDDTAKEALQQIKDRQYGLKFMGKIGEKPKYRGRILAVGIAYSKKDKKHDCMFEILRERI